MVIGTTAAKRIFTDVWICMKCNASKRSSKGKKPDKCRKCNSKQLRLKKKGKKKAA